MQFKSLRCTLRGTRNESACIQDVAWPTSRTPHLSLTRANMERNPVKQVEAWNDIKEDKSGTKVPWKDSFFQALRISLSVNVIVLVISAVASAAVIYMAHYGLQHMLHEHWSHTPTWQWLLECITGAYVGWAGTGTISIVQLYNFGRAAGRIAKRAVLGLFLWAMLWYVSVGACMHWDGVGCREGEVLHLYNDLPTFLAVTIGVYYLDTATAKWLDVRRLRSVFLIPTLFSSLWALLYIFIIPPFFRAASSDMVRALIRLLVHPLLAEIGVAVCRFKSRRLAVIVYTPPMDPKGSGRRVHPTMNKGSLSMISAHHLAPMRDDHDSESDHESRELVVEALTWRQPESGDEEEGKGNPVIDPAELRKRFRESRPETYRPAGPWLVSVFQLVNASLYGRFLVANIGSGSTQAIVAVLLGLFEVIIRLTIDYRDHLIARCLRVKSLPGSEELVTLRANYVIAEMIAENQAIITTAVATGVFAFDFGTQHQTPWQLVYAAGVQYVAEWITDLVCLSLEIHKGIPIAKVWKDRGSVWGKKGYVAIWMFFVVTMNMYFCIMFFPMFRDYVLVDYR